jgi:hypothetical protein
MATEGYEMPRLMWKHPDPKSTDMEKFRKATNAKYGLNLQVCFAIVVSSSFARS